MKLGEVIILGIAGVSLWILYRAFENQKTLTNLIYTGNPNQSPGMYNGVPIISGLPISNPGMPSGGWNLSNPSTPLS